MKVGIVGTGNVAESVHIPVFQNIKGVEIVSVCDVNESRAKEVKEKFGIGRYYTDLPKMLEKEEIDLIDICTPPQSHKELAIQAIEGGCHILVEKPMVMNVKEADEIIMALKRNKGVKFCVVHNVLFNQIILKAKSIIQKGELGDLLGVDIRVLEAEYRDFMRRDHWWHILPGGRFDENMPHFLYIIDDFLDIQDIISVSAKKVNRRDWIKIDELRLLLDCKNSFGTIHLSMNSPIDVWTIDIYGTKMNLHLDIWLNSIIKHKKPKIQRLYIANIMDSIRFSFKLSKDAITLPFKFILPKTKIFKTRERYGHHYLVQNFIKSIEEDSEPPVTAENGRKIVALQEEIFNKIGLR